MNTTEPIDLNSKIVAIELDVKELSRQVSVVIVNDAATEQQAVDFLGAIKMRSKRIEELRKFFTAPLNDQVKAINNKFKLQLEPLAELEEKLKKALVIYMDEKERLAKIEAARITAEYEEQQKKEREKIAEMERQQAELEAKQERARSEAARKKLEEAKAELEQKRIEAQKRADMSVAPLIEAPAKSVRAEGGLATAKKVWAWEVVDMNIIREERPDLFILDTQTVNKLVRDGTTEIPGIKIFQKTELNMRV